VVPAVSLGPRRPRWRRTGRPAGDRSLTLVPVQHHLSYQLQPHERLTLCFLQLAGETGPLGAGQAPGSACRDRVAVYSRERPEIGLTAHFCRDAALGEPAVPQWLVGVTGVELLNSAVGIGSGAHQRRPSGCGNSKAITGNHRRHHHHRRTPRHRTRLRRCRSRPLPWQTSLRRS
jgi:hypothetical protein